MNIIIVGAGEIGRHLAASLSGAAHNISVIESTEALATAFGNEVDARVIAGNGASINVLLDAGVASCELFLALTSDDNTNLVACKLARELGAAKTICRVSPGLLREEWLFDHRSHFSIDHLFSSERLSAVELSKFIRNPESISVEEIARGRIEIQQVLVSDRSDACGRSLRDVKLPPRVRIGSIVRKDDAFVPTADEQLEAGDLVTLFGEPHKLSETAAELQTGIESDREMKVVILGGGEYGFSLAQMIGGWNCKVRIFERDPELAEQLAEQLDGTTVINADATSIAELREEQVGEADFFIATTQSDEDNVMTCLQASNLGTKHCLALIHRTDYADALSQAGEQLGITAAVSPREATRRELMRFITSDKYHVVKKLRAGEVVEIVVRENSKAVGCRIGEVAWPEGCVLVALIKGIHASVPAADDTVDAGDTLYAMVSKKGKKGLVKLVAK